MIRPVRTKPERTKPLHRHEQQLNREFEARVASCSSSHVSPCLTLMYRAKLCRFLLGGFLFGVLFVFWFVLLFWWSFPALLTCRVSTFRNMTCAFRTHGVSTRGKKTLQAHGQQREIEFEAQIASCHSSLVSPCFTKMYRAETLQFLFLWVCVLLWGLLGVWFVFFCCVLVLYLNLQSFYL